MTTTENFVKGIFPNVRVNTAFALQFSEIYEPELFNGDVYFLRYSIGRAVEYDLLCDGYILNRRSRKVETYAEFFTRLQYNHKGNLDIKIANDDRSNFRDYYEDITDKRLPYTSADEAQAIDDFAKGEAVYGRGFEHPEELQKLIDAMDIEMIPHSEPDWELCEMDIKVSDMKRVDEIEETIFEQ